ncbi:MULTISPECIES: carbohydrate ABC transporter permease [Oceanobacillus]|uniref:carbohydrate ABC transporter permease n=1 Tax=Oceanobacillus TaxID=182709 RepID=UPI001EF0337B|nr:sugar ABC transporter permease [Oceanobacillus alkalisoli]MCF3944052.1 sugar ABC transporter permease [Oceanobacillus alkalisoli]MCG5103324.1 sugar ABC transporter permease [Oceanobacillus alkalisoli]
MKRKLFPYFLVLPTMIVIILFNVYPILRMLYQSFHQWNMINDMQFIGFDNFIKLASDKVFLQSLGNTFYFVFWNVLLCTGLGLLLAVFLQKNTRFNRFLQSISFFPYVVSLASVSLLWSWIMNKDYGLLNYVISFFGITSQDWLGSPGLAMNSIILISVWKSVGFNVLIFISALQRIPKYIYEAAILDNSGSFQFFRKITLPMISPTLFFITIINIINSFKIFETVQILTRGGPLNSTRTIVYEIYEEGTLFFNVGYASAMGVVLLVILAILTIIYFKTQSKRVQYQ